MRYDNTQILYDDDDDDDDNGLYMEATWLSI